MHQSLCSLITMMPVVFSELAFIPILKPHCLHAKHSSAWQLRQQACWGRCSLCTCLGTTAFASIKEPCFDTATLQPVLIPRTSCLFPESCLLLESCSLHRHIAVGIVLLHHDDKPRHARAVWRAQPGVCRPGSGASGDTSLASLAGTPWHG